MNLNPHNPTPTPSNDAIDPALLDEALAEVAPADLEAKIVALTDPQMLSLLDEALAPEPASEALTQRILAATTGAVRPAGQPTVLGRIGPSTLRYAAAAAITFALGLGIWFTNQDASDTDKGIAQNPGSTDLVQDNTTDEPDWLTSEQLASNTTLFDATTEPIQSTLDSLTDQLDDVAITRDTLWAELDAYEAFLDEIES